MNKSIGQSGEELVAMHLAKLGYKILKTNHRTLFGEIDIIAEEGGDVCFVEVKTRCDDSHGDGLEAVHPFKQKQLIKLAEAYLQDHDMEDVYARFDVVAVFGDPNDKPRLEIIKNAFEVPQDKW